MRGSRLAGTAYWPQTRIRRRGMAGYKNLRMRHFFKGSSLYLAAFLVFALAYVWTRVQVIETGYRLRDLETAREDLREENRSLLVEAATLRAPQRLETEAAKLGLRRPTEKQVYFLKK